MSVENSSVPEPDVPFSLKNDKATEQVNFLMKLLEKRTDCTNLNDLLIKFKVGCPEWKAIIAICANANGYKLFNLALNQMQERVNTQSSLEIIADLPEEQEKTLSVRHSIALFNKWCDFQGISPRHLFCLLHILLSRKGNKKVGIYVHGQSNSGKTYMTNGLFKNLSRVIGHVTNDNFPFQDLGEEVAITQSNQNQWKALMSGQKTPVERKGKPPAFCKPDLVLLSSNVPL